MLIVTLELNTFSTLVVIDTFSALVVIKMNWSEFINDVETKKESSVTFAIQTSGFLQDSKIQVTKRDLQ